MTTYSVFKDRKKAKTTLLFIGKHTVLYTRLVKHVDIYLPYIFIIVCNGNVSFFLNNKMLNIVYSCRSSLTNRLYKLKNISKEYFEQAKVGNIMTIMVHSDITNTIKNIYIVKQLKKILYPGTKKLKKSKSLKTNTKIRGQRLYLLNRLACLCLLN